MAGFGLWLLLVVGLLLGSPAAYGAGHHHRARIQRRAATTKAGSASFNPNPIIFVHGFDGSGAQFESQEMRLTSNGYPESDIFVFEYDSELFASFIANGSSVVAQEQVLFTQLDQQIAQVKAATHHSKVDLIAHSLGTKLMLDYLNSSPARAANVAHYVSLDGQAATSPPGGVPTLALWGTKGPISQPPGRSIGGAENHDIPDSSHVQTATSPLSFSYFYKFLTGKAPATTQIVPQSGQIAISGRDVDFPDNDGLAGATVQVWNIDQTSGQRIGANPIASFSIGSSGDFGPVLVQSGRRYEFAEVRPGFPTHHFYYEPFLRSDHLVRLLESDALRGLGGPPDPRFAAMVILRYKELWGDQGAQNDILKINGLSVCTATTCPLNKEVNALFAADFDHDSASNPNEIWPPYNNASPFFISSVDVFAPAQSPPTGEVTVSLQDRGSGPLHTISFPNFPSTTDVESLQFDDFTQAASANSTTPHAKARTKHHRRSTHRTRRSRRARSRRRPRPSFTG